MIREDVCWNATIDIVVGLVVVIAAGWVFDLFAPAFGGAGVVLAGPVALAALAYGVFFVVKGLWQVVEGAAAEAHERAERDRRPTPADDVVGDGAPTTD